ncbi:hypothetical protein PGT21_025122 [Puccinia graminis f. sp. tritici]|uniref:BED-type domain-containing protein n=1 Tax=Puccinia graminis f. sp. tritici TaxID=56615 RepID=A0A5B0NGU1_PUCGR|nr:hypothetical protein PGT21_025122 [Puccinia graminis f. sp. tritici]
MAAPKKGLVVFLSLPRRIGSPITSDADQASNANTNFHLDLVLQTATPTASQPSNSEETQQKTTSNIWAHFHQSGKGETLKATCKYCKKPLSAKSKSGTNHLWQHFRNC